MNTERPVLRPFDGLDGLERLASQIQLTIRDAINDQQTITPGTTVHYPSAEVPELGISLRTTWDDESIISACSEAGLDETEVEVQLVAEDSQLKERSVRRSWSWPIGSMPDPFVVAERNGQRERSMQNPTRGFELSVFLVLAHERKVRKPFRPHRRGTILARSRFVIRPDRAAAGLEPRPLDDDTRKKHGLPPSTVLFVETDGPLRDAEDLTGLVTVFVNEKLYVDLSTPRGRPERSLVLRQLAIDTWIQISLLLREELEIDFVWDGSSGALLRTLHALLKKQIRALSADDLIGLIRDEPMRLTAILSGLDRQDARVADLIADKEERA